MKLKEALEHFKRGKFRWQTVLKWKKLHPSRDYIVVKKKSEFADSSLASFSSGVMKFYEFWWINDQLSLMTFHTVYSSWKYLCKNGSFFGETLRFH